METYKEKIIDIKMKRRELEKEKQNIEAKIAEAKGPIKLMPKTISFPNKDCLIITQQIDPSVWDFDKVREGRERITAIDRQIKELNDDIEALRAFAAEEEPQEPDVPKKLEGIIQKAIDKGFINRTTYAWTESDALFGRFVWQCNRKFGLQKNGRTNYNIFSFIPNYKEIIGGAKNAMTRRFKERSTQIGAKGIDDLFAK